MRIADSMFCVLTAGMIFNLGAAGARGEARDAAPDNLHDRVFFDRSADQQEVAAGIQTLLTSMAAEAAMVPVASETTATVRRLAATAGSRNTGFVLAALVPPRDGLLDDSGQLLPWASGPAVPKPLSEPPPWPDPLARLRADPDAVPPRLQGYAPLLQWHGQAVAPRPETAQPPAKLEAEAIRALCRACAGPPVMSLEHGRPAMSRLPGRTPMSTHAGDPLAALQLEEEGAAAAGVVPAEFIMPFAGGRVTSLFNDGRRHPAIDLAGKLGSPVRATTRRQTVTFAGWRGGYGIAVIARDEHGREHLYGHLKSATARVGQVLEQGDQLGHLGSTGRSTGPHVHYEVRNAKGGHINPVSLLFPGRKVGRGLAWADVDAFGQPMQAASRVAGSEPAATAEVTVAAPRRVRSGRKARARKYRTAAYAHRSRRAVQGEGE